MNFGSGLNNQNPNKLFPTNLIEKSLLQNFLNNDEDSSQNITQTKKGKRKNRNENEKKSKKSSLLFAKFNVLFCSIIFSLLPFCLLLFLLSIIVKLFVF